MHVSDVEMIIFYRSFRQVVFLRMFPKIFGRPWLQINLFNLLHAVYLIPATPFEGLVLFYLLAVIYDVTVTIKIYLVT